MMDQHGIFHLLVVDTELAASAEGIRGIDSTCRHSSRTSPPHYSDR